MRRRFVSVATDPHSLQLVLLFLLITQATYSPTHPTHPPTHQRVAPIPLHFVRFCSGYWTILRTFAIKTIFSATLEGRQTERKKEKKANCFFFSFLLSLFFLSVFLLKLKKKKKHRGGSFSLSFFLNLFWLEMETVYKLVWCGCMMLT